ncbi:MarR family winged helix-turn-helix transcriptional regulator [Falsiroseomonas tokyonensis]|uniref:MarR family winged helix-turn-helix transcriptional regulator n=1 Tax=Falsiroseomonas tokyonensis TaxID=430521 RepID=A0ABV7BXV7_9PROT|nr:MarR family transcriptional regulator [Falsiroseomonas tokyonensis]MBU8539707.1 MarR family transcriptional regulator [Falsiroseomonas tokyonensis]
MPLETDPQAKPLPARSAAEDKRGREDERASPAGASSGPHAGRNLLFLREEELRLAQDLLFFGYRDFTAGADAILAGLDMGRAHHRVLHFVGRRPGITVGDLLGILGITKQSLGRVLTPLVEDGFVTQSPGRSDRRQRLLTLTEKGAALERSLFERQRDTVMRAYREAGPQAVDGFRRVMRGLMGPEARAALERLEAGPGPEAGR